MNLNEEKRKIREHFKKNRDEYWEKFNTQKDFAEWYHEEHIIKRKYKLYLFDVDDMIYDFLIILWIGEQGRRRYAANPEKKRLAYQKQKELKKCQTAKVASQV